MGVHIALIGKTKEPVMVGYRLYGVVSRLYLLHSPNTEDFPFEDLALEAREDLKGIGFFEIELMKIDAFDMHSVIGAILSISKREQRDDLFVNITGGTNLMAAAACTGAFIVGAKAYYVLDTRKMRGSAIDEALVELPIPRISLMDEVQGIQRDILRAIDLRGGEVSNVALREELGIIPQKLGYHIKHLESKGLIETAKGWQTESTWKGKKVTRIDSRILTIKITDVGRLTTRFLS